MRLVQQARQAHEAPIFFQVSNTNPSQTTTLPLANGNGVSSQGTALLQDATSPALSLDPVKDQNEQGRKLDFVSQKSDKDVYNPHPLQSPASPYELLAGTVIPASLITGINSDLPGLVIAQVTEDIFDSVSGVFLLLPRGSRIIGAYDSVVAFGQSRALIVWQRLIMPNGTSIQIDNLPASDTAGYAGLSDQVDYHTWTLLKGIAMSTLLGVGSQVTFGNSNSNLVEAIRESTQESTNQAGQQIVQKALNIQPTITVQPGWSLVVVVHKDIVLKPYRG
jgi:type IV secretion system protein VirB10